VPVVPIKVCEPGRGGADLLLRLELRLGSQYVALARPHLPRPARSAVAASARWRSGEAQAAARAHLRQRVRQLGLPRRELAALAAAATAARRCGHGSGRRAREGVEEAEKRALALLEPHGERGLARGPRLLRLADLRTELREQRRPPRAPRRACRALRRGARCRRLRAPAPPPRLAPSGQLPAMAPVY
jgi:hypothetical protein